MQQSLEVGKFLSLKRREFESEDDETLKKLEVCTQSIHRWLQYCEYHYANLKDASQNTELKLDRISVYRRAGDTVPVRYVYEANIAAFLNSLHSLIDSFPYLLNIFIPVFDDLDSTSIKWHENFLNKYRGVSFYDDLIAFMLDPNFHKVKGYVNTIKHKHLIQILNKWDHLEFENYSYNEPYRGEQGQLGFRRKIVTNEDVSSFVSQCHDDLIPKLFNLCDSILRFKEGQLRVIYNKSRKADA